MVLLVGSVPCALSVLSVLVGGCKIPPGGLQLKSKRKREKREREARATGHIEREIPTKKQTHTQLIPAPSPDPVWSV
jgi:hypothetical protein